MINTLEYKRGPYKGTKQGICPCGTRFLKKTTGKYCNRCKDLRRSESGRRYYEDLIKP